MSGRRALSRRLRALLHLVVSRVSKNMSGILPPPRKPCLPLAARGRSSLLLMPTMKRPDLVKQLKESCVAAEHVITHLPEVPRCPLAGFCVRDRTP
jgi:hypothetical protein